MFTAARQFPPLDVSWQTWRSPPMSPDARLGPNAGTVSLLSMPFDANSSFLRGAAQAPRLIREALYSDSSNLWTEDGTDLGRTEALHDAGDLDLPENSIPAFSAIESAVWRTLRLGHPLISLCGVHPLPPHQGLSSPPA